MPEIIEIPVEVEDIEDGTPIETAPEDQEAKPEEASEGLTLEDLQAQVETLQKEAQEWKAQARKHEDFNKKLKAQVNGTSSTDESEETKTLRDELEALKAEALSLKLEAAKDQAIAGGLPKNLRRHLRGNDPKAIAESAKELLEDFVASKEETVSTPKRTASTLGQPLKLEVKGKSDRLTSLTDLLNDKM